MTLTHRMQSFLDISLSVPDDKPTHPKKLCGMGADDKQCGEYVLTSRTCGGSGGPLQHALRREGKASRGERRRVAADERRLGSGAGQAL